MGMSGDRSEARFSDPHPHPPHTHAMSSAVPHPTGDGFHLTHPTAGPYNKGIYPARTGGGMQGGANVPVHALSRPTGGFGQLPTIKATSTVTEDARQATPTLAVVRLGPIHGGIQEKIAQGDYLFLNDPFRDVASDEYVGVPIWALNAYLEEAHITQDRNRQSLDFQAKFSVAGAGRKRASDQDRPARRMRSFESAETPTPDRRNFAVTDLESFRSTFFPLGIVVSDESQDAVYKRLVGIAIDGAPVNGFPNVFGQVQRGDVVGWLVKEYENENYTARYGPTGERLAGPTNGSFLQVRGWVSRDHGSARPFYNSSDKPDVPLIDDLQFVTEREDTQSVYQKCIESTSVTGPNGEIIVPGLIDYANSGSDVESRRVVNPVLQNGFFIPIGRVLRSSSTPSPHDIAAALRSPEAWRSLQARAALSLAVFPNRSL